MRSFDIPALIRVLIEERDVARRSAAHRELARRAAAQDDLPKAVCHYREAFALDPTDEVAREALQQLGPQAATRRGGLFGRLVRGFSFNRATA